MSAPERLPEYPHQLAVHYIETAARHLEHAADAPERDKPLHLKRADAAIRSARNQARAVAARWRDYNARAAALGAWINDQEDPA